MRCVLLILLPAWLLVACGGGSGGSAANGPGSSAVSTPVGDSGQNPGGTTGIGPIQLQAVLGPLVGATAEVSLLADRGNPAVAPLFTTATRDGATLAEAGTFEIPRSLLANDEIYVIRITGGVDVDPQDDGRREPQGQEIDLRGSVHAVAIGGDLLTMGSPFRVNALTEVAYQVLSLSVPDSVELSRRFVANRLDRTARSQLVDAGRGGDGNGDGRVDRLDLAHFRPAVDTARLVHGGTRLRALAEALLGGTSSGLDIGLMGTGPDLSSQPALPGYSTGTFAPPEDFSQRCAVPRGSPWTDRPGTARDEKNWLRSWSHDRYLWFDEIEDVDPAGGLSTAQYFARMKTRARTASGALKDRFHFSESTDDFLAFFESGMVPGYGAEFAVVSEPSGRKIRVTYTHPDTPATNAGLKRGDEIVGVDQVAVRNGNAGLRSGALFNPAVGASHTFQVLDPVTNGQRAVTLVAADITTAPVQHIQVLPTATGPVGYFAFHDHIGPAETALLEAVTTLEAAGIVDLVVDLRYNGGGYLAIAQQLASMVAGPQRMTNRIFSDLELNVKHQVLDPFTGERLAPDLFLTATSGIFGVAARPLPGLDLDRVFVITGAGTCSASEIFINGLLGVGVEVVQIGAETCGKPYGFAAPDNCGVTYFSVNFHAVNAEAWGDFGAGFRPGRQAGPAGIMPGCLVGDDLLHALGDPQEARLAAALRWRASRTCPASTVGSTFREARGSSAGGAPGYDAPGPEVGRPAWRQNAYRRL